MSTYSTIQPFYVSYRESPHITVAHFLRWQSQVLALMNKNSLMSPSSKLLRDPDPENGYLPIPGLLESHHSCHKVHIVYDKRGCSGKTSFLRAMIEEDSNRVYVLDNVPHYLDLRYSIEERRKLGWTGDCIIFNIRRQFRKTDIHRTIEEAMDDVYCRNIWIFTTRMLKLDNAVSEDRWKIFKIEANLSKELMSNLIPISIEDAQKIFLIESRQDNNHSSEESD